MRYGLFEVVGLELEYPLVDADLRVVAGVEELFRRLHGRPTSSVALDGVELSNELAAHVLEIKNRDPLPSLVEVEEQLHGALRRIWGELEGLGWGLLPTGMHPTMRVAEGRLWRRAGRRIYETYARVFDIRQHGWLNIQSSHVNFPFGPEQDTPLLHNAVACLLPYLPALAASSPIVEGEIGPRLDMRMEYYRVNQREIPEITGDLVPEYMSTPYRYRRQILDPIYRRLDRIEGTSAIRNEFVNSRGAIPKFYRDSLEVRALDMQECVRMDVAVAAYLRGATHHLVERIRSEDLALPPHELLVRDFEATLREGRAAAVEAAHVGGPATAGKVLAGLLEPAVARLAEEERPYLELVEARLRHGCLAERILEAVGERTGAGEKRGAAITAVYRELMAALRTNSPWRLQGAGSGAGRKRRAGERRARGAASGDRGG